MGRPVGASGEQTRRRILAATMRCVAEVGYAQATIREIARMADVTSASLYNYFPNKAELIKATLRARADASIPRLREAAHGPGSATDRIEAVLDECGDLLRTYPQLAAFEWAIRAEVVDPAIREVALGPGGDDTTASFGRFREILRSLVEEACLNGELLGGDTDSEAALEAIYALIYGLTELAAVLPPHEYHAALSASKVMVRGELFGPVNDQSRRAGSRT
ncbi:TetR family transcriptional regulator [Mycobacterium asiaticum]|uniref:TetR family transcriptional regulator n=1 Tax=Mycobacterium asiaticum TaxID=1790 RepID=A0A1A3NY04_MYCAS|nr:TetR/AcrR family transcriptional regulator [Mycobacterium asiaticum]OBK25222.1 TetR family transcriptional regulator [Mycobacterium asiaticum]